MSIVMVSLKVYLAGVVVLWVCAALQYRAEPTTHGRSILVPLGCLIGLGWPLMLCWMVIISPWLAWLWWKGELS